MKKSREFIVESNEFWRKSSFSTRNELFFFRLTIVYHFNFIRGKDWKKSLDWLHFCIHVETILIGIPQTSLPTLSSKKFVHSYACSCIKSIEIEDSNSVAETVP